MEGLMDHQEFSWKTEDGVSLFGQVWQPEKGLRGVIALVHGLGEHSGRYQHVAEFYCKNKIAVITFDLRGHGKSEGPRGHAPSFDAIMVDIHHLLDEAKQRFPGKPVILRGHSLGGALVLYFGLTQKADLKGIVCTSPGVGVANPPSGATMLLAKTMSVLNPTMKINNNLDRTGLSRDPEVEKVYSADPNVHPWISARLGLNLLTKGPWIIEHAAEFPYPLLLMQGTKDRLVSPAATEKFAQNAPAERLTYKVWEGYYHELHNEPEKADVLNFELGWVEGRLVD
jgi:alpha-beta hydrolase superfamily lysophospholipase